MDFELSREDFTRLPKKQQNLAIYDNIISIRKDIRNIKKINLKEEIKFYIGYLWLFLITVFIGLKKYILNI